MIYRLRLRLRFRKSWLDLNLNLNLIIKEVRVSLKKEVRGDCNNFCETIGF